MASRKNVAVRKPSPPARRRKPQVANLGDMVTALLDRPEVTSEMLDRAERLLNMHRQQQYASDMVEAQDRMRPIFQDADNDQTKSKYATYLALDRAIRPIYTRYGFAMSFGTAESPHPDRLRVVCDIVHRSGLVRQVPLDMPVDTKGPKGGDVMTKTHATISALSYAKRGLLKAIWNLSETKDKDDDDGNKAGGELIQTITDEELDAVRRAIVEADIDIAKVHDWAGVETLAEMPRTKYELALVVIRRAGEAKAKAVTDAAT